MPKKLTSAVTSAAILFAMLLFLSSPAKYAKSVTDGISLWAAGVLPAVFPFLFLTALFTGTGAFEKLSEKLSRPMGALFRVSGAGGGAAILSAVSGYPVGARTVADLKKAGGIGEEETFRLACLCSTSGPMFLVGTVGDLMYGSAAAGWVLLASHLLSVWTVCFFLRFTGKALPAARGLKRGGGTLYDSLYNAVISILCVGGCIALFSCFGQMLLDLGVSFAPLFGGNERYGEGVMRGLIEMTTGCAALKGEFSPLSLATSCALVTFGGLCVLCQQLAFLTRAGVKALPFLLVKTAQAALSFLVCFALSSLFFAQL